MLLLAAVALVPLSFAAAKSADELPRAFPVAEAPLAATLAGIDREWNLSFRIGGKLRVMAAAELAYWGRYRESETGPQIVLVDGGTIHADMLLLDETRLVLGDATGLGRGQWDESSLPRTAVRGILLQPPASTAERDRLWLRLLADDQPADRLLLVGGESIEGTIIAAPRQGRFVEDQPLTDDSFALARRGSEAPLIVPAAKAMAVQFGSATRTAPSGIKQSVWLGLADGSLVRATSLVVRGDAVALTLAAGGELKTTLAGRDDPDRRLWDAVTYLEAASPRVAWLSDLPDAGYKQIPYLSIERPAGRDASVLGTRLRNGRALFRKGLGMPSAARLAYDVNGFRRLEAELGIDERAGLAGSVVFKVVLQDAAGAWRTAYTSPPLGGGEPALTIAIDLQGARRLALLTDFSDRGDACDWANWLMARLVK